jgi:putative salt-induced outer membrane protein YdiY
MAQRHKYGDFTLRFGILIILLTIMCVAASADRKDVIVMKNGDHLTGDVKKLANGVLYVDLEYVSGTTGLDWNKVERLQSSAVFHVTLKSGEHLIGKLEKATDTGRTGGDAVITATNGRVELPAAAIVEAETRKPTFWRQLTGSMSLGSSYTSGNGQVAVNSQLSANYGAKSWAAGTSYTSSFSGQSGSPKTNLVEIQTGAERYLSRNSFVFGLSDFLHSSQQQLSLRTTLGGGYGRYLVRATKDSLRWFGGVVYTREQFTSTISQPVQQNVEGLLGVQYRLFAFDRYTLETQLFVYPGLSDFGRIRSTTNNTFNVKLSNKFTLSLSLWDNFDSRPPVNAKKNELGVSTGIGWSF